MGKKIKDFQINPVENSIEINIENFQEGHYFTKVKIGSAILINRFIKSN